MLNFYSANRRLSNTISEHIRIKNELKMEFIFSFLILSF